MKLLCVEQKNIIHFFNIALYCTVFLFSPNIIHMIVDSSVCNIV